MHTDPLCPAQASLIPQCSLRCHSGWKLFSLKPQALRQGPFACVLWRCYIICGQNLLIRLRLFRKIGEFLSSLFLSLYPRSWGNLSLRQWVMSKDLPPPSGWCHIRLHWGQMGTCDKMFNSCDQAKCQLWKMMTKMSEQFVSARAEAPAFVEPGQTLSVCHLCTPGWFRGMSGIFTQRTPSGFLGTLWHA